MTRLLLLVGMICTSLAVFGQRTITGKVVDDNGEGLIGATVIAKEAPTIGTITDFDGTYKITIPGEVTALVFSYTGFSSEELAIGNATTLDVTMTGGVYLDEMVIVGYGSQRKSDITSSISTVNGDDLRGLITPTFADQLAGRAAGVQVTTQNGILGEGPRVRIRGIASVNSGTDPLYVIDGMPVYSGDLGGYASASGLGDLNPSDIESMEVLKDGAATAIYGSRAANGVILITTKKGKEGKAVVTLNSVFGVASPVNRFDLLKTADFITISNEKRTNRGQDPWAIGNTYDTDWQDAVLNNNAFQMDHNLSISGGTDKTKYYFSTAYANQDGIAKSNSMDRISIRTNLEHKLTKWFALGGGLSISRTAYTGLNTGANSLSGNVFNAIRQLPNTPILNPDHPTGYNISENNAVVGQWDNTDPVGDNISNVAYVLEKNVFESTIQRTMANVFASADIVKGLNYRFQASVDNPNTGGFLYWDPIHGDGSGSNGRLQNSTDELLRWNIQNILNYNTIIGGKHSLGITAGTEHQKERNSNFFAVGTDLLNEFYNQNIVSNAYAIQESGGGATEVGIISYLSRVNYNYDQRYFVQASVRRDGISKLSPDNRWNSFTGFSVGWNISNESFMANMSDVVSLFKLRYSFSSVGNTEIGSYPYLGLSGASPYGSQNGIAFSQFGNDALTWETSAKSDFGIDLGLYENRFNFTFDYFKNDIDNLVFSEPVAPSLGVPFNRINKNIGKSINEGFEFGINYDVIRSSKFTWNVGANLTLMSNEIVALPNGGADIIGGSSTNTSIAPNIIIREGESMNSLYGFQYWGVNPANGNPVYIKANGTLVQGDVVTSRYYLFDEANPSVLGESSTLSAADDKVILGNTLPTYFGGLISKLTYKNLDLNMVVRFSGGNKIFNSTRRGLFNQNLNNNGTEILGRWQSPENPGDGVTPILWASSNTFLNLTSDATTRFVEDADFIKLDNLSIGYNLPSVSAKRLGIAKLRVFVQGQNLLVISKYKGLDPEMETSGVDINGTPRARVLSFGLNVGF